MPVDNNGDKHLPFYDHFLLAGPSSTAARVKYYYFI